MHIHIGLCKRPRSTGSGPAKPIRKPRDQEGTPYTPKTFSVHACKKACFFQILGSETNLMKRCCCWPGTGRNVTATTARLTDSLLFLRILLLLFYFIYFILYDNPQRTQLFFFCIMGEYLTKLFPSPESMPKGASAQIACDAVSDFPEDWSDSDCSWHTHEAAVYGMIQTIFMGLCYAAILFYASNQISEGSEKLLLIPSWRYVLPLQVEETARAVECRRLKKIVADQGTPRIVFFVAQIVICMPIVGRSPFLFLLT